MQLTIRAVSIRASGFTVLSETLETLNPQARTLHVTRVLLHPRLLQDLHMWFTVPSQRSYKKPRSPL